MNITKPLNNLLANALLIFYLEIRSKDAFQAFVDRFTSEASTEIYDLPKSNAEVEEVENLIRNKLEQLKMG